MSNMIKCGTCGYPLTPEERTSLVEHNGRMVKPWQGLTAEEAADCWSTSAVDTWRNFEAALREKNT